MGQIVVTIGRPRAPADAGNLRRSEARVEIRTIGVSFATVHPVLIFLKYIQAGAEADIQSEARTLLRSKTKETT